MRLLDYLKSHHTQVHHHLNAVFLSVASILLIAMQDKIAGVDRFGARCSPPMVMPT